MSSSSPKETEPLLATAVPAVPVATVVGAGAGSGDFRVIVLCFLPLRRWRALARTTHAQSPDRVTYLYEAF